MLSLLSVISIRWPPRCGPCRPRRFARSGVDADSFFQNTECWGSTHIQSGKCFARQPGLHSADHGAVQGEIYTGVEIQSVARNERGADSLLESANDDLRQVVFCCHGNQILPLLESPTDAERSVLATSRPAGTKSACIRIRPCCQRERMRALRGITV